jgi:hypothetical protein
MPLTQAQLLALARLGAQTQLEAIIAAFPDLAPGAQRNEPKPMPATPARHSNSMSAAQRKAVSRRMKAYWAKRRAEGNGR